MSLTFEQLAAIDAELTCGHLLVAVRDYRDFTGSDLTTAKLFVDSRHAVLLATVPNAFRQPIAPKQPDEAIMATIRPISDRELRSLRDVLKKTEKLLYGFNYQVTLSANAASLPYATLPVIETMKILYPDSDPGSSGWTEIALADFNSDIIECLAYEGDSSSGPQFSDRRRMQLSDQLIPDLWLEMAAICPLDESTILSYNSDSGLPGYHTFWFFAYLIHCSSKGRCLIVTGMSSD